ncbi:hypothetical protein [uncultured Actinomyces sp.]|jgi:hypothetical protein|uniref:hypothetical protein n=1 Tax=uncultured Actinomyces sp. TaxID=249061 RepID=UPI00260689B7|nr:hypothetical protein [uncultured Actinomyces sp.]
MGYQFEKEMTSPATIERIAKVIKEVGEDLDFLGPMRKMRVKVGSVTGSGSYGFFSPTADDDPFATASQKPDWSIGWQWGVTRSSKIAYTSWEITSDFGYAIIFHVYDNGPSRTVRAKVSGTAVRKEPTRFIELVFGQL